MVEREFLKHVRDFGKTIHWKSAVIIPCPSFTMGMQGEDEKLSLLVFQKVHVPLQHGGRETKAQF